MEIINFRLPQSEVESFKKFCAKIQKNVPEFKYSIGSAYDKVFKHPVRNIGGKCGFDYKWHSVCDAIVEIPEDSGWRLLATYEDGLFFPSNPKHELILKNPSHGKDYNRCDVCSHWCKKSYLIVNADTDEELQVGSECAKKFGLKQMEWISKFTRELNRVYDYFICCKDEEDYSDLIWNAPSDKDAFAAIDKTEVICAAKAYFDEHPKWIAGYWEGRTYVKSKSNEDIQQIIIHKDYQLDKEYCNKVCEWVKANINPNDSEFSEEMVALANNFYSKEADAAKAYFMVKKYEDWLKSQTSESPVIEPGMHVKVAGNIVAINTRYGSYGNYNEYAVKTPKGYIVTRAGAIPITRDKDGSLITSFYAEVKYCRRNEISVGRALKNAKKGISVTEL